MAATVKIHRLIVSFGTLFIPLFAAIFPLMAPAIARVAPKPIMVHYMPWFQSPYSLGGDNGGYHWTLHHFNPTVINPANGEGEAASWYYPLIGPYDSSVTARILFSRTVALSVRIE